MPHDIEIAFRVDTLPVAQPRPRVTTRGGFAQAYTPSDHPVHDFKLDVIAACRQAYDGDVLDMAFFMAVMFYFKRPGNKIWKAKSMPNEWKTTKPDLDNLVKPIKDCLTGIVWTDDNRIVDLRATKVICAGTHIDGQYHEEKPGCEILIRGLQTFTG